MKFLGRDINLVIFDMDGTLIDSTGIWAKIDEDFFAKRGMEVPVDYAKEVVLLGLEKGAIMTKEKYHLDGEPGDYIKEWRDASINQYRYEIPLKECAIEILEFFKKNDVKLALVTANEELLYKPCLERLGLVKYFDLITDVDKMHASKGSAKLFNDVSKLFNIKNENAAIFEDSIHAIKTSYANDFLTIAVYDKSSESCDEEKILNSHLFIHSFKELL